MKKKLSILLITLFYCFIITGCSTKENEDALTVYSFSGENELFSITNGVIVLSDEEEIFYGGILSGKQGALEDITSYTTTFYIWSANKKHTLLSNRVIDMTGGTISLPDDMGKISGDSTITRRNVEEVMNNLYFELKTTDLYGNENVYQLQLALTEVTGGNTEKE